MTISNVDVVITDVARRYLKLHLTGDVGPIRLGKLINHFGSVDAALSASMGELERVAGIGPHVAESIFRSRGDDSVDREIERAAACGVRIICFEDGDYPRSLQNIPDPPICLYVRGRIEPTDCVSVAIVGTRRCSHYGREQAIRFGQMLGGAGFTVVSGLARGIDSHAHRGALQGDGRTIAVLGNGLASIYPPEHQPLAEEVMADGALISEFPIDSQPAPENFPRRNRIITGLSLGVLVVEAGKASGALITARLAAEYNREVFALPGRVDRPELTLGVHGLIRDGQAKLVTCLEDVLDELGQVGEIMGREGQTSVEPEGTEPGDSVSLLPKLTAHEQAVLNAVVDDAEDADAIACKAGLDPARVMSTLTSLQLKGLIRQLPGYRFVCRSSARGDRAAR